MRRALALAAAALACTVSATAAHAAQRTRVYDVTFHLVGDRTWTYAKLDDTLTGDGCHHEEHAAGSEHWQLQTPHPERVSVTSGISGQPPLFMGDNEAVLRLTGHDRLDGTHTDVFSGGCDAGNPDVTDDTSGCGDHSVKTKLAFAWAHRDQLGLITMTEAELQRERCPWDVPDNVEGDDGRNRPDITDVLGPIAQRKVGGVPDFTVRGATTWHGTVPPHDDTTDERSYHVHGEMTVTWHWEAKFHQRKKPRWR